MVSLKNTKEYKDYLRREKIKAQGQAVDRYGKSVARSAKKVSKAGSKAAKKAFTGAKKVTYSRKLSRGLISQYGGVWGGQQVQNQQSQAGPGRPKNVYKHTSPFTGQPIPATEYYKQMREFRRVQARRAEDLKEQALKQYAQRGVAPSQIQNYNQQVALKRQQALAQQQQQPQQLTPQQLELLRRQQIQQQQIQQNPIQALPNGAVVNQATPVWKYRRGVVDTDWTAFGRKKVIRGTPGSFFN